MSKSRHKSKLLVEVEEKPQQVIEARVGTSNK